MNTINGTTAAVRHLRAVLETSAAFRTQAEVVEAEALEHVAADDRFVIVPSDSINERTVGTGPQWLVRLEVVTGRRAGRVEFGTYTDHDTVEGESWASESGEFAMVNLGRHELVGTFAGSLVFAKVNA
ncbi:hypothetical protein [Agromyces bauzanensis]